MMILRCLAILFFSLTALAQPEDVFRFAVISDLNKDYGSTTYLSDLHKSIEYITKSNERGEPIQLVLSTGDMVAGQKNGLDYKKMWDAFHQAVTIPLNGHGIPLAPSPGNHDASGSPKFANERVEYQQTFLTRTIPSHLNKVELIPGSEFPFYYAFKMKNVLFVALDATLVAALPTKQYEWLEKTLDAEASVKIVFGHVPLYPYAFNRANEYMGVDVAFGKKMEALLESKKVKLFLTGHHHAYYPASRKSSVEYVSVPLLGDGARPLIGEKTVVSDRGFLIFEYSESKGLKMKAIKSADFKNMDAESLPASIRIPKTSSPSCVDCATFPAELFLPGTERDVYLKSGSLL